MRRFALLLLLVTMLAVSSPAQDLYPFDSPQHQARFGELLHQYRCLVCQNQTLADSDAPLAKDLRQEIYRLVQQNRPDAEIEQYLVSRYSDYVHFSPPFNRQTSLLWLGPLVLLLIGLIAWLRLRKADA